jgi:hypothetical protein
MGEILACGAIALAALVGGVAAWMRGHDQARALELEIRVMRLERTCGLRPWEG